MDIRVVCIGTELLIGHTLNSNLAFLGETLESYSFPLAGEVCIPDDPPVMREVFRRELEQADLLISVGGLGPTSDDLTRTVAAEVMGMELEFQQDIFDGIADFLGKRKVPLRKDALTVQSMVPRGAEALANRNGTAPGLWCPFKGKVMLLLPGPPRELIPMFRDEALPRILTLGKPQVIRRSLTVTGVPESVAEDRVQAVLKHFPGIEPAYCARPATVDIRFSAPVGEQVLLERAFAALREEFKTEALSEEEGDIVGSLARLLTDRRWTLAVAESCTGGLIGAELTSRPGSSTWFAGGVITYANELKARLLSVSRETLDTQGAVSGQTAREMVEGLLKTTGANCGIAVTGIAGPEGGTPEKPVGRVYIAVAVEKNIRIFEQTYPGDRENVRLRARATAFVELRKMLLNMDG